MIFLFNQRSNSKQYFSRPEGGKKTELADNASLDSDSPKPMFRKRNFAKSNQPL